MIEAQSSNEYGQAYVALDRFGNQYTADYISVPDLGIQTFGAAHVEQCQAGMFTLYFDDVIKNYDCGFDESTLQPSGSMPLGSASLGELRQNVVWRVFEDLSVLINEAVPGTTNVNIRIVDSGECTTDSTLAPLNTALAVGGPIYRIPYGVVQNGVVYGEVWKAINGATDHLDDFHGILRFNFDQTDNQQFYLDPDSPATGVGLEDLYTVTLHEAIHALGFLSLIDSAGVSLLDVSEHPDMYSAYDTHLEDPTGNPFIIMTGAYGTSFNTMFGGTSPLPVLTSGCGIPAVFNGDFSFAQNIHSPTGWVHGTSLSHFNCVPPPGGNGYVMNFCTAPEAEQRYPIQAEVNALCDLAYAVNDTFGNVLPTHPYIHQTYDTCTLACIAAGGNDIYTMNPGGTHINVSGVFDNDHSTSDTLYMLYLEIVTEFNGAPAGNLSNIDTVGGTFTYTPPIGFFGRVILRYIPNCGNDGVGNMTFITISIPLLCDETVILENECELICHGHFENISDPFAAPLNAVDVHGGEFSNSPELIPLAHGVGDTLNTFQWLCHNGEVFPPPSNFVTPNTQYVIMGGYSTNPEALFFEIREPLVAGESYLFTFDAYSGCNITLSLLFSEYAPCPYEVSDSTVGSGTLCSLGLPSSYTYTPWHGKSVAVPPTFSSGELAWLQWSDTITMPSTLTQDLKYLAMYNLVDSTNGFGFYDNFSLIPLSCCSEDNHTLSPTEFVECCLEETPFTVTDTTTHPNVTTVDGRPAYVVDTGLHVWDADSSTFTANGWTAPGDPVYLDVDLVVPPGAELNIQGIELYFAPNRRLLVQKGQASSSFGGVLRLGAPEGDRSNLYGLCYAMWQGIQVEGPGTWTDRVETANGNNYGTAILSGHLEIFDAIMGISGMNVSLMDVFNLAYGMPWVEEFDPNNTEQTSIPYQTISAVGLGTYIQAASAKNSAGGVCQIGPYARFSDCLQGVNLCWYKKNNTGSLKTILPGGARFSTKLGLKYPFSEDPNVLKGEAGVWLKYYNHIAIGDSSGNTFTNLKFGIREAWTNNLTIANNRIQDCDAGISLLGKAHALSPNLIVKDNQINNCHSGIQAAAVEVDIKHNIIGNGSIKTLGVYLMGSDFVMDECNEIYNTFYGAVLLNNDSLPNVVEDNLIDLNAASVWVLGNNAVTQIADNEFNHYWRAILSTDYMPVDSGANQPTAGVFNDQGVCNISVGPADNVFVNPFDTIDIFSSIADTFEYRHRANATYIFEPALSGSVVNILCNPGGISNTPSLDCLSGQQIMMSGGGGGLAKSPSSDTGKGGDAPTSITAELRQLLAVDDVEAAITLLQNSSTLYAKEKLLHHYLEQDDYASYFDLLEQVPETSLSNMEMKRFYNLYGTLKMEGRTEYELTPDEEAMVREIAASNTRWVYEAQALLYLAYNEEYPIDLPPINDFVDEATLEQFMEHEKGLPTKAEKAINVFPNPANTHINIQLPDDGQNVVFELFNLNGELLKRVELTGSAQVSTHDLPNGIYIHKVSDAKGITPTKGKTVIIH